MTRNRTRASAEGLPEINRRRFLFNTASAGAMMASATVPAMAVQPVDPKERIAAAVRELEAAMTDYMVGRSGYWQACLIQGDNGRVTRVVARFGGEDILDRDGKPAAEGGAS